MQGNYCRSKTDTRRESVEKASEERGKKLLTVNILNGWRLFAKEGKAKDEGKWRRIGETTKEGGGEKGRTSVAEGENRASFTPERF